MEKTKQFFGKKGKLRINPAEQCYYRIEFESMDEVFDFYDDVRKLCYEKNYGLRPSEWAAYGKFTYEDENFHINAPRQSNGDNNWFKYSEQSRTYCEIYSEEDIELTKKEREGIWNSDLEENSENAMKCLRYIKKNIPAFEIKNNRGCHKLFFYEYGGKISHRFGFEFDCDSICSVGIDSNAFKNNIIDNLEYIIETGEC